MAVQAREADLAKVTFLGPAGTLEGYLHLPEGGGPFPGVVVCHPHPLRGGDMSNNVVAGICRGLAQVGIASLSFNFRGVGESQGAYDDGRGEVEDALAALRFLASQQGIEQGSVGLAGYSFGGGVAMKVALHDDLPKALSVVAWARLDSNDHPGLRPSMPIQFVVGDRDQLVQSGRFNELAASFTTSPEIHMVPGADHFFLWKEREVGALVAAFFHRWLKPTAHT
ncbi:MAG: dienelactone hydrolase family protein [Chloroflexi bacterium]|nr:dienelactone hydrolase family protein [Chloroflexota bacterium]